MKQVSNLDEFLEKNVSALSHDKTRKKFYDSATFGDRRSWVAGGTVGEVSDQVSVGMTLDTPLGCVADEGAVLVKSYTPSQDSSMSSDVD